MRSSSQNFRQFALFLCLFLPSHAAAGDDWDCGDWACSNYGLAITNAKTRSGRESYLVFVPEEKIPDNCSEPNHAIFFSEKNNLKSAKT